MYTCSVKNDGVNSFVSKDANGCLESQKEELERTTDLTEYCRIDRKN